MSFHIGATKGEIAEKVLMPGDPLRAKFIAENFLTDVNCYNAVRNMFGYTGVYKGARVSVQGAGMGIPSTLIYATELVKDYGVKSIIRVGTVGSIKKEIKINDIILGMSACTDSNINKIKFNGLDYSPTANFDLLVKASQVAKELALDPHIGIVFSTDNFYNGSPQHYDIWAEHGVLGLEMESTALYTLAAKHDVSALTILTVSDNLVTGEVNSSEDREKNIESMARIALETII